MKNFSAGKLYALAFGLFLGLCLWKFGNPVILDQMVPPPVAPADFLNDPWPPHWAGWFLLPLAALGAALVFKNKLPLPPPRWLWLLPLAWLAWQFCAATQTVDARLTEPTFWHFAGCVACYFLGALVFAREKLWRWLLPGLLLALVFCLERAVTQHVYEFPQNRQALIEGERTSWTNFTAESLAQMKQENIIITTNGVEVANPVILAKFTKNRVFGTLVYPNALAGVILLLLPVSLAVAFGSTRKLKPLVRYAATGLLLFLGGAAFIWSGSKLGWLVGIGLIGVYLLRRDWSRKLKWTAVATVLVLGLGIFAVRFQHYFAAGATSTGARLDYWRAAVQTTLARPVFGTGPGTFQRPYAQLKAPDSEMARLTHNDYLEQFSDSGVPGGLAYAAWIGLALLAAAKAQWRGGDALAFAIFLGLLGWFAQGLGEFSLYVPALAWTAFTLLGSLVGNQAAPAKA